MKLEDGRGGAGPFPTGPLLCRIGGIELRDRVQLALEPAVTAARVRKPQRAPGRTTVDADGRDYGGDRGR